MRSFLLAMMIIASSQWGATATAAPKDAKKFAITDPAKVDEDFRFQGEYYGALNLPLAGSETTGIQVVARGDGNFIGRQLRGGLPGNGWDTSSKVELEGKRKGDLLTLKNGDYQVVVDGRTAVVTNASGTLLGALAKIHRESATLGLKPNPGAIVLFDGTNTEQFVNAKMDDQGNLRMGTTTKDPVQDFHLHLEFRLPYMPYATGQSRGNSGVYIQERYEVQVLDSFGLPGEFNDCASIYRTKSPDVNMSFPPLTWQSYDIYFTAARFDDQGSKIASARITVVHNGIIVQNDFEIPNKTGAGKPEGPEPRVIKLQNHSNPVIYRNIWIEHLGPFTQPSILEEIAVN